MFNFFEWMMAFRYLRARRQEGFISIIAWFSLLGISLGVATLIIVMSVMNGFRHELLTRILGLNGHITITSIDGRLSINDPIASSVNNIAGVNSITPMIQGQVMASSKSGAQGVIARAIKPKDLKLRQILASNIKRGSIANFGGKDGLLIGKRLAETLRVKIGDRLTLISPKGSVTAFGTVPRMKSFKILAVFEIGMFEYDANFIFMPMKAGQTYFKMKGLINNIEVFVDKPDEVQYIKRAIRKHILMKSYDTQNNSTTLSKKDYRVYDWQKINAGFFNAIQVERNVMFLILTLIILVAAFNIISSMIMMVNDKSREIAILRTMGASRGAIMRIFFIAGSSIGVLGTVFGLVLGMAFANNIEQIRQWIQNLIGSDLFAAEIYFLSQLPAIVNMYEVVTVVVLTLILTFLATIYPAWRAARLEPADALRYE